MKLVHALVICLMLTVVGIAQTSAQLQQKFGKPIEAFSVRPDILMTVEYDTDGNARLLTLEPRHAQIGQPNELSLFPGLRTEKVELLLTELIPPATRGERLKPSNLSARCMSVHTEFFTNVSIQWASACAGANLELYSVQVRWRNR